MYYMYWGGGTPLSLGYAKRAMYLSEGTHKLKHLVSSKNPAASGNKVVSGKMVAVWGMMFLRAGRLRGDLQWRISRFSFWYGRFFTAYF